MHIILLSGGSGSRLWPLSNESRSKQFLKLLKDDNNYPESMLQRIYRQIKNNLSGASITISTSITQVDAIKSQLGDDVDIVIEPERRDTFPAIILACAYLYFEKHLDDNEVVIILPVDPYVDIDYFNKIKDMAQIAENDIKDIILMGILPTFPATKFGYILSKENIHNKKSYYDIDRFIEKPSKERATSLLEQSAVWNGGVFAFKLKYIINLMNNYAYIDSFKSMLKTFSKLPITSFDYEVVEKSSSLAMVIHSGMWKDLGTWESLTEVIDDTLVGNSIIDDTAYNTTIINELDIPVMCLGIDNAVIATSPDGILLADKLSADNIKKYNHIKQRPMYEIRRWGEYKILSYGTYDDGSKALVKQLKIKAGKGISYQIHHYRDEIWTIIDGQGEVIENDVLRSVFRGDVAYIKKNTKHSIKAVTDLTLIEVQIGVILSEDDIERFNDE